MPRAKPPLDSLVLVRELVALPGPPGQEDLVRDAVAAHVSALGYSTNVDPKGNLLVRVGTQPPKKGRGESEKGVTPTLIADRSAPSHASRLPPHTSRVVITAHLDEIALMVSGIEADGKIEVIPLGGALPWKWGEQPVEIMARGGPIDGILSFGCAHSGSQASVVEQARTGPLKWGHTYIFTGMTARELFKKGVRPGTRVALHRGRRTVMEIGDHVSSYFLDDRADLVAWLLALEAIKKEPLETEVLFAATTSEEVGGEGAQYLLHQLQPDICVALEIGPSVPECPFEIDENPTVWVTDSYASMAAVDMDILAEVGEVLGQRLHWQPISRGGSDATCSASKGLTARPVTLGFPVENSHGLEIMHRDAPAELARLTVAYLRKVCAEDS